MAICGSVALLLGFLAGQRFRIAAVLLAEMIAAAVAVVLVSTGCAGLGAAGLGFTIFTLAVQAGYGLGLVVSMPAPHAQRRPAKA